MTNNKSKKKVTSAKYLPQSRKKSAMNSGATSQASIPASRASIPSSQPSRHATVEEYNDDEDDVSHIGGMLDADGDRTMKATDGSDSKSKDSNSELSKTIPVFILASRKTHVWQNNLQSNRQHQSMPSLGQFLLLSMLKVVIAILFSVLPGAAN